MIEAQDKREEANTCLKGNAEEHDKVKSVRDLFDYITSSN